jgi:hypothetical protein
MEMQQVAAFFAFQSSIPESSVIIEIKLPTSMTMWNHSHTKSHGSGM